ncbi:outer membrane protein assembly factor BamD [Prevotella sp. OH937_COT-195]|uniref:outer membrane protein assembly factor BamD n=1 Tax=Prevotella sp. OH937_COT-195 TaxID=2491051 RepID=UPI000F65011A|nr:outer membrane protein assembly factor BamD [Prevotella sp. OH937_COT-195]RRD03017.1 outer membrane protein assembly factor BamD [Prevotella sp. OH937_COT-195]
MKKIVLSAFVTVLLLSGCAAEFNKVYKSGNAEYKYEYAKECFAMGKYIRAVTLLQELVTIEKGTDNGEECLYMLAMAEYLSKDYQTAAEYFKKYFQAYPKGTYAEMAAFYIGESLYMSAPEPRLDQTPTYTAITAYQEYLDIFPNAAKKYEAQKKLMELQDKLVQKELATSELYYNLGSYFGNCLSGGSNYEACVITAENALKDYPFCKEREKFATLIMKSKYELAEQSVESKKLERFRDAEDECYGFINEYPDSKERTTAEKYIERCKKFIGSGKNSEEIATKE